MVTCMPTIILQSVFTGQMICATSTQRHPAWVAAAQEMVAGHLLTSTGSLAHAKEADVVVTKELPPLSGTRMQDQT